MTTNTQDVAWLPVRVDVDDDVIQDPTPGNDGIDFEGTAILRYSPECRAAWADITYSWYESTGDGGDYALPQLWYQPQYGAPATLAWGRDPDTGAAVNWLIISENPVTFRTPLTSWNWSQQLCVWVTSFEDRHLPNPNNPNYDFTNTEVCTEWR